MPWKPSEPGEVPTLGWYVLDWMRAYLARPAVMEYEPFEPYLEQEDFILRWYELDPLTGRFKYQRGLLGRPRGWGKSPILGGLCIVEGLADVLFDGWDANGQPVGRPWHTIRTPLVHVAAVSEGQTNNTWQPMVEMLGGPVMDEYDGIEPFDTVVNLPVGKIEKRTSSGRSVKGAPTTFAVLDQTEEWVPENGGPSLAQKIRTNTSKNGGRTLESPNAYIPGQNSVAEASATYAQAIKEGRSREKGLLWDHREAPAETDLSDRESLVMGLRTSYGDSSGHPDGCVLHDPPCPPGHVDLDAQISVIWDPATDVQVARSDYLNQITHASDSWVTQTEWRAVGPRRGEDPRVVDKREPITLGFDGSRSRARGKADATALIGCTVRDGHLFELRVWEQPDDAKEWEVPALEVDAEVRAAFTRYNVVGFYADPAKWESYVADWESKWGPKLKVKAGVKHPIQWWMTGGRSAMVAKAIKQLHTAIEQGDMSHDGAPGLMRHMLNARRRIRHGQLIIDKEYPDSPNKIDAAVAAVLAWQARLDAVAMGIGSKPARKAPRRIR